MMILAVLILIIMELGHIHYYLHHHYNHQERMWMMPIIIIIFISIVIIIIIINLRIKILFRIWNIYMIFLMEISMIWINWMSMDIQKMKMLTCINRQQQQHQHQQIMKWMEEELERKVMEMMFRMIMIKWEQMEMPNNN